MKTREARGKFNIGKSIDERSEEVKTKKAFEHWELDSEVLPREGSKTVYNICRVKDEILCSNKNGRWK